MSHVEPPSRADCVGLDQAERLSAAKAAFTAEFELVSGRRAGAESVLLHGEPRTPSFQLDQYGDVLPVVADVIQRLRRAGLRGWSVALWFTAANSWLNGARPVDLLGTSAEQVRAAADEVGNFPF